MIIVNFKIYEESFGDKALSLAKICRKVGEEFKVEIVPAVSALDAVRIKEKLGMKVFLQSVDEFFEGAATGSISPIQAKALGIDGAILNHSENRLKPGTLKRMLKNWPKGFESVVCIQSFGQTERWAKDIKADFVAYEPKHLIGSKDKSVATEEPEMIKKMVQKYKKIPVLVGAGIKSEEDMKVSKKMGAKGLLISSSIVKAKDPESKLRELIMAFK